MCLSRNYAFAGLRSLYYSYHYYYFYYYYHYCYFYYYYHYCYYY
jgi:hypothetical protein